MLIVHAFIVVLALCILAPALLIGYAVGGMGGLLALLGVSVLAAVIAWGANQEEARES